MSTSPGAGTVRCKCLNTAILGERKNCNLPGVVVDLPTITDKDRDDLVNWGVRHGVDFIAASFVRKGVDLDNIRAVLGPEGAGIQIISKIENQEGLQNFDDILAKSDGIMVARGDLGMEIPMEKVRAALLPSGPVRGGACLARAWPCSESSPLAPPRPLQIFLAQKMMIQKCNAVGKPVVTATQMLESMIKNPRPTRAEVGVACEGLGPGGGRLLSRLSLPFPLLSQPLAPCRFSCPRPLMSPTPCSTAATP